MSNNDNSVGVAVTGRIRILSFVCCCFALLAVSTRTVADDDVDPARVYRVVYEATLDPKTGHAHASLTLKQPRRLVRSISLSLPDERYLNISTNSKSRTEIDGDRVTWFPGKEGGTLRFDVIIDHQRTNGDADARITRTWALLKLDHLFPSAAVRATKGATSKASLKLAAPKGWAIETPYGWGTGQSFSINDPHRNFDQPRGWILAGEIGVRREKIGERHISVASPLGSGLRAGDLLAFLRWTLPSLIDIFPDFPQRILIVSGMDDMWRGGLSGRASLYLHPDRPLISGNRTSPIMHELFHVAGSLHAKGGADWIIEGLAEFYSLTLLLRSGGISEFRYNESFDSLADWSAGTQCTATDRSHGKLTANATLVMRSLDTEIRAASNDKASLDTLVQNLADASRSVTNSDFRAGAMQLVGGPVQALANCP